MMFHGVETTQKMEMKRVARKMLIYLGAIPVTSFENGYDPAATWLPIVARMKAAAVKNLAARESKFPMTAGMYHSKLPQMYWFAEVTKMGVSEPRVPIIGSAKNW